MLYSYVPTPLTHELEDEVDILVVIGFDHVEQLDDVLVVFQRVQEHDLSISALGVGSILERINNLLQRYLLFLLLIDGLPYDSVSLVEERQINRPRV